MEKTMKVNDIHIHIHIHIHHFIFIFMSHDLSCLVMAVVVTNEKTVV